MAAVRVFYMRVMNDDMLRPFFEDIDLARLKNKLVESPAIPSLLSPDRPVCVLVSS